MPKPENVEPFKWKKGQSGNPKGRPKLPDIKEAMGAVLGEERDGKVALDAMLMKLRQMAINGNIKAAELLLKYSYSLPAQRIESDDMSTRIISVKFERDDEAT